MYLQAYILKISISAITTPIQCHVGQVIKMASSQTMGCAAEELSLGIFYGYV